MSKQEQRSTALTARSTAVGVAREKISDYESALRGSDAEIVAVTRQDMRESLSALASAQAEIKATTEELYNEMILPTAPINVSFVSLSNSLSLTWDPPVSNGSGAITGYRVVNGATVTTVTQTSVTLTGLTNGQSYTIGIAATNAKGTGPSTTVTTTPGLPHAPTITSVSILDTTASLSWQAASTGAAARPTS